MVLHRPPIVFTIRFFPLFKPSNNEHSSLRRVYSPNICSCHSFNSIFGYLHKMTHNLMKLLQPRKWENYWGPIITCNLQFRQHSITTSNGHHKPSLQNTESWIRSFPGSVRGDFIDNPPKVKRKTYWTIIETSLEISPLKSSENDLCCCYQDRRRIFSDQLWLPLTPPCYQFHPVGAVQLTCQHSVQKSSQIGYCAQIWSQPLHHQKVQRGAQKFQNFAVVAGIKTWMK